MTSAARIGALAALAASAGGVAAAAPAPHDPGFAGGGKATVRIGSRSALDALATAADGAVVAAGQAIVDGREEVLVMRRTVDGSPDPAFGGGSILARFGDSPDAPERATAIASQPDGSVLVAGIADVRLFLARYRPDGTLDPTFGAGGVAFLTRAQDVAFDRRTGPAALAVMPDGRIVVAGSAPVDGGTAVLIARTTPSGVLDTTFNHSGVVVSQLGRRFPRGGASSAANALAPTADGRLLVAGRASDERGRSRAMLSRFSAGGALERGLPRGEDVFPAAIELDALTPDGDGFLVAGSARDLDGSAGLVARVGADGSVDTAFRERAVQLGLPRGSRSPASVLTAIARDGSGGIVAAGRAGATTGPTAVRVLRLTAAGDVRCTDRDLFSAAEDPARGSAGPGGALVVGATVRHAVSIARLIATDPAAGRVTPHAATGPARRQSRRTFVLTGVADPGCGPARARFVAGRHHLSGWRLRASDGPQTVFALVHLRRGERLLRYRLVVERTGGSDAR